MPAPPTIEDCLFHRCDQHVGVSQLNAEEATGSECGACIAEEVLMNRLLLLFVLEGYADRLTYSGMLRAKLIAARGRLNMLSPGAGDFLDEFDKEVRQ